MSVERRLVALAAGVLLSAASCTGSAGTAPSPSPTATASQSPSATATLTENDRAKASAQALVHEYYDVLDAIRRDPEKGLAPLATVSAGEDLETWRSTFEQWKREGWTMTGTTVVSEVVVQSVSTGTGGGELPAAVVDVCVDVTGVDVVDPEGKSVVLAERPDRSWERLQISNADYATDADAGWRVVDGETLEQEPCSAE